MRNLGKDWRNQYLCALLLEVLPQFQQVGVTPTEEAVRIFEKYSKMLEQIKQMDLLEVWDVKPILDVGFPDPRSGMLLTWSREMSCVKR